MWFRAQPFLSEKWDTVFEATLVKKRKIRSWIKRVFCEICGFQSDKSSPTRYTFGGKVLQHESTTQMKFAAGIDQSYEEVWQVDCLSVFSCTILFVAYFRNSRPSVNLNPNMSTYYFLFLFFIFSFCVSSRE